MKCPKCKVHEEDRITQKDLDTIARLWSDYGAEQLIEFVRWLDNEFHESEKRELTKRNTEN